MNKTHFLLHFLDQLIGFHHFGIKAGDKQDMVNTQMEGRVDNVERDIGVLKGDVNTMKEWMMQMHESIMCLEGQGRVIQGTQTREPFKLNARGNDSIGSSVVLEKDPS